MPSIEESIDDEELMALILKEFKIEAGSSRSNSRLSSDLTPNKSCDSPTAQKQCTSPAFQRQLSSPTQKVSVLKKLDEKFHRDLLRRTDEHRVLGGVDKEVARLLTGDNS